MFRKWGLLLFWKSLVQFLLIESTNMTDGSSEGGGCPQTGAGQTNGAGTTEAGAGEEGVGRETDEGEGEEGEGESSADPASQVGSGRGSSRTVDRQRSPTWSSLFVVFQDLWEKEGRGGERESTAALGELVFGIIGILDSRQVVAKPCVFIPVDLDFKKHAIMRIEIRLRD